MDCDFLPLGERPFLVRKEHSLFVLQRRHQVTFPLHEISDSSPEKFWSVIFRSEIFLMAQSFGERFLLIYLSNVSN